MKSVVIILAASSFISDLGEEAAKGFEVTDIGPTEFALKCQTEQKPPLGEFPYYKVRMGNKIEHYCINSQNGRVMYWMRGRGN